MSLENLKEYARRCASEPELRDRAKAIGMDDAEEHMRYAESMGLAWTPRDMMALRKEMMGSEDDLADLSEDELEQIAGGILSVTATVAISVGVAAGAAAGIAAGAAAGAGAVAASSGKW